MRAKDILSTPTLTLPHQGGGNYLGNFKYLWVDFRKEVYTPLVVGYQRGLLVNKEKFLTGLKKAGGDFTRASSAAALPT